MISSVIEYLKEIENIKSKCSEDVILFFRGETSLNYETLPKIWRKNNICDCEYNTYHKIMIECPEYFDNLDHLSTISLMRHYGGATRLLDITSNPLVALCFACQNHKNEIGKVIVYKVKRNQVLFHNSDKALMLSCLPLFKDSEQNEIMEFCEKHNKIITDSDIKNSIVMKRFLHEIRHEFPAFEAEIVGDDLLNSHFLISNKTDKRMKAQSSAYIIVGLKKDRFVNLNKNTDVIEIKGCSKDQILKDLSMLGISIYRLYSDLENMIANSTVI